MPIGAIAGITIAALIAVGIISTVIIVILIIWYKKRKSQNMSNGLKFKVSQTYEVEMYSYQKGFIQGGQSGAFAPPP